MVGGLPPTHLCGDHADLAGSPSNIIGVSLQGAGLDPPPPWTTWGVGGGGGRGGGS